MSFTYEYARPAVSCDVVVFSMRGDDLAILAVKRKEDPFRGAWALPGGFVNDREPLEKAAARELYEETGLSGLRLEQVGAFGDPGRDPRGHTISVAYVTFVVADLTITAGDDAEEVAWKPFRSFSSSPAGSRASLPTGRASHGRAGTSRIELAFDHGAIASKAYSRLCRHLEDPMRDGAFALVPARFTLSEMRRIYEIVLGRPLTPATIRAHLVSRGLAVPVAARTGTSKRGAQLYRWNQR